MKKSLLAICLLATSFSAMATVVNCVGMDSVGQTIHLLMDTATTTVNVNGDIFNLDGITRDKKGLTTEEYVTTDGIYVYLSLQFLPPHKMRFYQFNAATNKLLARGTLSCYKE